MFILLISRGVPSKRDPQWGCFEKDQAEALVAAGHKVVVISVDSRFRLYWRKIGITYSSLNGVHYYSSFICPGAVFKRLFGLHLNHSFKSKQIERLFKRVIKEFGIPDVIYSHYLFNSHLSLILKEKYNIPIVAIEHWSQLNKDVLSKDVASIGQAVYSKCDTVISVSESLRKSLLQHFNIDSIVINNMVGAEFLKPSVIKTSAGKVCFVSIGSLIYRKGFDLLIAAFKKLNLPSDCWQLIIIGEGEEHEKLQIQINNLGLADNVSLTGSKNKEEIVKILSNSDVFVLPSRCETFGVVYIEAMMIGLPVIATICGGPEHFVQKTDGLVIPVDDVDALSNAIKEMYENHHKYDRKKIAEDARNRFSPAVIAKQLTDVFSKVTNKQ